MYRSHAKEAEPIIAATLNGLLQWAPGRGRPGADLRSRVGLIQAEAPHLLQNDAIGEPMAACFDLAIDAGMTLFAAESVRKDIDKFTTKTVGAGVVKDCMIQLTLVAQARIIAMTNFRSRQDVEAIQAMVNATFNSVAESVSDRRDSMTWLCITSLHASLSFYLIEEGRPRPDMMNYRFNQVMTTLTTSYRLYTDASRCDEIRYENRVVHPAFALPYGKALSA